VDEFIEDAGFGEGEGALEKTLGKDADFPGVKAVELADLFGAVVEAGHLNLMRIGQVIAFVNDFNCLWLFFGALEEPFYERSQFFS
jgi:hypothetical protein